MSLFDRIFIVTIFFCTELAILFLISGVLSYSVSKRDSWSFQQSHITQETAI